MALLSSEVAFEIIEDLKRVYSTFGRISKRVYAREGKYSDRQVKKHFGGFSQAFDKAGLVGSPVGVNTGVKQYKPTDTQTLPVGKPVETIETTSNAMTITKVSRIHTLEGLIDHFQIDLEVWDVERFVANKWEMAGFPKAVGESRSWSRNSTEPIITPLYQVKATFIKKKVMAFAKLELDALKSKYMHDLNKHGVRPFAAYRPTATSGNVLEINVPDLHAGKLAWAKETGYKDYDTKIALDTFDNAIDALLARSSHIKFDKILFVVGNDMMHSDTIAGTTTSGTQLDNDSRYHKTFVKLRNRLIDTINHKLLPIAPVHIIGCPGNHDKLSAWHLADSLQMYFHDYEDVSIDNSPEEFKFFQWGQVMLMFAHGNTGKKPDYPLTMATKRKEMWAATTYREAHTGHVHQTQVQEYHGVRVRILPALCEPDAWHAANNFVGNLRTAEAYAWNDKEGLINKAFYNAP